MPKLKKLEKRAQCLSSCLVTTLQFQLYFMLEPQKRDHRLQRYYKRLKCSTTCISFDVKKGENDVCAASKYKDEELLCNLTNCLPTFLDSSDKGYEFALLKN